MNRIVQMGVAALIAAAGIRASAAELVLGAALSRRRARLRCMFTSPSAAIVFFD